MDGIGVVPSDESQRIVARAKMARGADQKAASVTRIAAFDGRKKARPEPDGLAVGAQQRARVALTSLSR
ncbi:hypothetical protein [Burkholderia territorii]|uniref:hypothetical protein n=1 Tax=Burkholderia territorii TaxID=1503055 RepID=UPI001479142C|nr:hypothetical protein [Burkholderia territorii]MBM2774364.1 hypothetical protein [Burkholderia territorii]